ncbi:MAG: hypothetical protein L6R35_002256, partial [Caloplaca aegaea]
NPLLLHALYAAQQTHAIVRHARNTADVHHRARPLLHRPQSIQKIPVTYPPAYRFLPQGIFPHLRRQLFLLDFGALRQEETQDVVGSPTLKDLAQAAEKQDRRRLARLREAGRIEEINVADRLGVNLVEVGKDGN